MATDNGPSRDVSPSKNSFPDKKRGESFNEAMNEMNTPRPATSKRDDDSGESYNISYDYCEGDNS